MKYFTLLLLSIGTFTFTFNTNCMLLALRNAKRPLLLPRQQKRLFCHPIPLEQRMETLEKTVKYQGNELAEIKAIVGRWDNDMLRVNMPSQANYDPNVHERTHDSYIDEHNMHYMNTPY